MAYGRQPLTVIHNLEYFEPGYTPRMTARCVHLLTTGLVPSSMTTVWSDATELSVSTPPEGQWTTIESTRVAAPNPKCSLGSLADSKLLLPRTSATWVRPPALTSTLAPNPSRFERLPT